MFHIWKFTRHVFAEQGQAACSTCLELKTFPIKEDAGDRVRNLEVGPINCTMYSFCPLGGRISALKQMMAYIRQMKSDLHKIFSILKDWSPELIKSVCARAGARVHAQDVETCTQLWAKNKPSYFK